MTLQIEGVAHVIKQLTDLQQTPNLDSPQYIVLKKTKEYEVRQYSPYLVAETSMPTGTRPAGGDGFNNLAGYIFGDNSRSTYPSPATSFTCAPCAFHAAFDAHIQFHLFTVCALGLLFRCCGFVLPRTAGVISGSTPRCKLAGSRILPSYSMLV